MKWSDYYERYDDWQESTQYSRLASVSDFGPEGSPSNEIADCVQYVNDRTGTSILRRALAAGVRFSADEVMDILNYGSIADDDGLKRRLLQSAEETAFTGSQLCELMDCFFDDEIVEQMLDRICSKPTHFTEQEVIGLLDRICDDELMNKIAGSTDAKFTEDGLNRLCDCGIAEEIVEKISRQSGIPYQNPDDEDDFDAPDLDAPEDRAVSMHSAQNEEEAWSFLYLQSQKRKKQKKPSLLQILLGEDREKPADEPHYGYRYGRWYYGRGHTRGCERGDDEECSRKDRFD